MKSYSKLRRRAAIGRARFARRPVLSGDDRAAARLPLPVPPGGTSDGDSGRATLHLSSAGNPLEAPNDPLHAEGSAPPASGPAKGTLS